MAGSRMFRETNFHESERSQQMKGRSIPAVVLVLVAALGLASQLRAYPGGTPRAVTNAAPYCASCH